MKILIVCDRENWAYDAITKSLLKHLKLDASFSIHPFYLKNKHDELRATQKDYDLIFFMGWQLILEEKKSLFGSRSYVNRFPFIENDRILTGIHSHRAWDNQKTLPDHSVQPPEKLVEALKQFKGVNVVSRRLTDLFRNAGLDAIYTPNGVDEEVFKPIHKVGQNPSKIAVGFSGSKKHDFNKGVNQYIKPLASYSWIDLKLATPQNDYVKLEEMPKFYNTIDVYLCASSSEGFSLSVLEAASCGRPIVSTRVGGSDELIQDGVNGFFVKRNLDEIVEKIDFLHGNRDVLLKMAESSRRQVVEQWSWQSKSKAWFEFMGQKC